MSGFVGLGAALLLMVAIVAFIALTLWLVDRTGGGCIIIALLLVTIGGIALFGYLGWTGALWGVVR
jgi:hypothetical protein